jgi:hypothetical protein
MSVLAGLASPALAHDVEKTQVVVTFAADGRYVVDILNEPNWLWASLAPAAAARPTSVVRDQQLAQWTSRFVRSVALGFDDHNRSADRVEYFAPLSDDPSAIGGREPALMRLTGTLPAGSRTFRLAYALVVDPFPITVHSADGTSFTTWLKAGEASAPIVLTGLRPPGVWHGVREYLVPAGIAMAFVALVALRYFEWSAPRRLHDARPHHG